VVLTGIRPEVAQMLVSFGGDLDGTVTRGNLHSGIAFALEQTARATRATPRMP
jgi:rsbT co-antagonist protein RsbR